MMKTTLLLSTIAAAVLAVSTTTFAQSYGNYAQAVGQGYTNSANAGPYDRFTRTDLGYQGNANDPRVNTQPGRTPYVVRRPAQQGN
jgi:hypothetical protein